MEERNEEGLGARKLFVADHMLSGVDQKEKILIPRFLAPTIIQDDALKFILSLIALETPLFICRIQHGDTTYKQWCYKCEPTRERTGCFSGTCCNFSDEGVCTLDS